MLLLLLNILSFIFQSPDKLTEDIDRYLAKELPGYEKIEFKVAKLPVDYKSIEIIESSHLNINGSTAYVPVKITSKENKSNQTFITLNVKLYKTVFTAKEKIDRKIKISESDFDIKQLDVAGVRGKVFPINEKMDKYRSKTFIRKDEILCQELLERVPVILTGDRVKAYFLNGTVAVDFFVNARQDGIEGDIIRVVTADNKQYKAKIIDSKSVIINE